MRWTELESPDGGLYVDLSAVCAIGPSLREGSKQMRAIYLMGGQCVVVMDTPENLAALFQQPRLRAS